MKLVASDGLVITPTIKSETMFDERAKKLTRVFVISMLSSRGGAMMKRLAAVSSELYISTAF
ncbi:hypothetical protein DSECCO2_539950 [anaerobic digester metagenome]